MKKFLVTLLTVLALPLANMEAQQTYNEMELITVNEKVTTVITSSEPIRLVDISTDKVAGDKPMDTTIRLKPTEGEHKDGEILGIVTIVAETFRTQYALIYTTRLEEAVTDKEIQQHERLPFKNPAVTMSSEEMVKYARRIWNSPAAYRNISTKKHRMVMRLNNVYSVGDYFFLDFSIENKTNLRFDIDELRFTLKDKKQSKSTNVQTIDLKPAFVLDPTKSFRKGYRNVVVLKKMTFPNDKVLTIEISEKQISGRTISMAVDYEDILDADTFNTLLLKEE